jgi:protoporphyrinogen oxidase
VFKNGEVEQYEALVSTLPVPELIARCTDLPQDIRDAARGLRCVSVYNLNLGVERLDVSDKHWIYFPEKNVPFYRAGFPMNFSPSLGPPGCSSLYVELSHQPTEVVSSHDLIKDVRLGLERIGIFKPQEKLIVEDVRDIRYAYVLYDQYRARVLPAIFSELERRGIYSVGRYGRWEHTSMEDAIAQGKQLGERLSNMYQNPNASVAS